MNIYLASSWRNTEQPRVLDLLRSWGHKVYDFRQPRPGDSGFHWSNVDGEGKPTTVQRYLKAIMHPVAEHGFRLDYEAMRGADAFVLPTKILTVDGAGPEQTKLILLPCLQHGKHVVLGGGAPGDTTGALHLHVDEVNALIDVLRAGVLWAGLHAVDPADVSAAPGDLQGSTLVRGGIYAVSVLKGRYTLSWRATSWPDVGLVFLDDVGRERAIDALLELLHGKAAAA